MPPERIEIHARPRGIGDWWVAYLKVPELRMTVTQSLCEEGEEAALAAARRIAEGLDIDNLTDGFPALPWGVTAARWMPELP